MDNQSFYLKLVIALKWAGRSSSKCINLDICRWYAHIDSIIVYVVKSTLIPFWIRVSLYWHPAYLSNCMSPVLHKSGLYFRLVFIGNLHANKGGIDCISFFKNLFPYSIVYVIYGVSKVIFDCSSWLLIWTNVRAYRRLVTCAFDKLYLLNLLFKAISIFHFLYWLIARISSLSLSRSQRYFYRSGEFHADHPHFDICKTPMYCNWPFKIESLLHYNFS